MLAVDVFFIFFLISFETIVDIVFFDAELLEYFSDDRSVGRRTGKNDEVEKGHQSENSSLENGVGNTENLTALVMSRVVDSLAEASLLLFTHGDYIFDDQRAVGGHFIQRSKCQGEDAISSSSV